MKTPKNSDFKRNIFSFNSLNPPSMGQPILNAQDFRLNLFHNTPVSNVRIDEDLILEGDGVLRPATFENCTVKKLEISPDARQLDLTFAGHNRIEELIIRSTGSRLALRFDKETSIGRLIFKGYSTDSLSIDYEVSELYIDNSEKYTIQNLVLIDYPKRKIKKAEIKGGVIHMLNIDRDIETLTISLRKTTRVTLNAIVNSFTLSIQDIQQVLCNGSIVDTFTITGNVTQSIDFDKAEIQHLNISTLSTVPIIRIKNSEIANLIFSPNGIKLGGRSIHLHDSKFEKIDLTAFYSLAGLELKNARVSKELNLESITFDVNPLSTFDVVDLRTCTLKLYGTKFNDTSFFFVDWPTKNRFYEFRDIKRSGKNADELSFKYKNLREVYRKLRIYFYKNGDPFDAMVFQANEIRTQYWIKIIDTRYRGWKSFLRNFPDWFLLFSNSTFSNFGLSWTRPMYWWLPTHLVLVYFLLSTHDLHIQPMFNICTGETTAYNASATWEGFNVYLKLLFPVHDSELTVGYNDKLEPIKKDIWGKLDFLIRLFGSYFIFLIIRGTRKFNFKLGGD